MNSSAISWISQQGMDSSMFMDSFDEGLASAVGQDFQNYLNPGSNYLCTSPGLMEQPKQQTPADNYFKFSTMNTFGTNPDQASSAPNTIILNFGNQNLTENVQQANAVAPVPEGDFAVPEVFKSPGTNNVNFEEVMPKIQPTKKKRIRPPSQTYDHIIAERRRREQLSQLFVALSALVPGLKKMDKSSILEDAIKYMKLLQERVKTLEEKAKKKAMESVVLVKKWQIVVEDEESSDELSGNFDVQPLPEIEAGVCDNRIFIRVHCEKQKDVLVNLISKVESLNLIIVSTNSTPFGNVALYITIVAEMEKEFNMTMREVVTALRAAIQTAA